MAVAAEYVAVPALERFYSTHSPQRRWQTIHSSSLEGLRLIHCHRW